MNPEQLWRPIVEPSGTEGPATHMRKPLSLPEVELCLFPIFNVEIHANHNREAPSFMTEVYLATE